MPCKKRCHVKKVGLSVFGGEHHKNLKTALFWKIDQKNACFTYIR